MKTFRIKFILFAMAVAIAVFPLKSCDEEGNGEWSEFFNEALAALLSGDDVSSLFGWKEEDEKLEEIESDINFGDEDGKLPSKVDLSNYFPPIGNQGQYGTCVAWATGYNLRSFLDAYAGNYSPRSANQQYSPKYLFWAIDNNIKGSDCNGTNFEPALDLMIEKGIATLADVPYDDLGDCSSSPSAWHDKAAAHKLYKYRKINYDVGTVKAYLAQNRPVAIGARLGDNFMAWDNDNTISYDTYNQPGMMHAYHAMAVSGYDDSKQAFRVVNSWDTGWGDKGYIWVDYNFFQNNFCFAAFVASIEEQKEPDQIVVDSQYDLASYIKFDAWDPEYNDPADRVYEFNAYNKGTSTIPAGSDWNILYLYYDAYDAEKYDIINYVAITDDYSTDAGSFGDLVDILPSSELYGYNQNWYINVDINGGSNLVEAFDDFEFKYTMPSITGYYYLVQIVDGFDAIQESDEENNYYFLTDFNGDPLYIENGVVKSEMPTKKTALKPTKEELKKAQTAENKRNINTYSPTEIKKMLIRDKKSGRLAEKVNQFRLKNAKKQGIIRK